MNCDAHLGSPTGLPCTQPAGHTFGHVYESSWAPDGRHDDGVRT